jgi:hypothetical protein
MSRRAHGSAQGYRRIAKEPHIIDAKLRSGRLLLISADVGDGRSRNAHITGNLRLD